MGDKCRLMQPKEPRVGDKWETSVGDKWETSGRQVQTHAAQGTQSGRQVWETSEGDKCGRQVGDKCKIMRPKTPRVKDKCGRQVEDKRSKLMRPKEPRV